MATNSCQNMNDEKKYAVIPFIGQSSIIFKESFTKNLEGINLKKVQYLRHLKFKTSFL